MIATTVFKFEKISNYMTKNVGKNRKLNNRTLLQYCRKILREFIIHSTVAFAVLAFTSQGTTLWFPAVAATFFIVV